eukprot:g2362.t1
MADIAAVEQAKENIFPLKRGRDAAVVLRDDNQYSEEQQQQKLKFEQALSSPGADHLGAYHVYAKWWQQNLGSCGGAGRSKDKKQQITQEGLVALLEEALKKFLTDDATEMYRRDYRYLGLWLMYGENALRSSTDMFAFLWARQIGVAFGLFYMAWAAQLERDRRFEDCDDCYKMGIARKAEPLQKLQEDYESSGKRTAFNVLTSADAGGMARPTWDQRGILGSQPGAVGNAGWGKMGSSSSSGRENWDPFDDGGPGGGAERKNLFDSQGLGMQQPQPAQESSFEMFCDDEFQDSVAQPMTGVVEETTLGVGRFTKQVKRMFGGGDDGNTTGLLPTRSQLLGAARGRAGSGSGTATGKTDKNGEEENEDELTFATKRALKEVGGLFGDREDTTGVVVQPNPKRPKKLLRAHSSVIGAPTTLPDASHSQPAGFVSRSVSGERSRLLKPQISVPATSTSVVFEPSARQTLQDQNRRVEHDPMSMSQGDVNPHSQEISGPLRRHGSGGSASAQLPDRMMRARTPSNEKRKPPGGVNNPPGSHSKPLPRSRGASPSISLNNSIHFREAADIHIHRGNYDENEAPPDPALAATMADLRGDNSVNVGGVNIPSAAIGGNLAAGGSSGSSSSSSANNSYQASANAGNFGPPGMSNTAGGGAPSSSGSGAAAGSSSSSYTNLNNQPISQGASGRIISGVSPRNPRAGGLLFGNRNTLPYFGPSGRSNSNNSRNAGGATANANENSRSQQEFISAALRRDNSGSRGRSRSNKPVQDMSQVTKAEFEIFDEMASPKAASRVSSKGSGGRLSVMIQSSPSDRSGALQNEMLNRSAARKSQHGGLVFESTPGQREAALLSSARREEQRRLMEPTPCYRCGNDNLCWLPEEQRERLVFESQNRGEDAPVVFNTNAIGLTSHIRCIQCGVWTCAACLHPADFLPRVFASGSLECIDRFTMDFKCDACAGTEPLPNICSSSLQLECAENPDSCLQQCLICRAQFFPECLVDAPPGSPICDCCFRLHTSEEKAKALTLRAWWIEPCPAAQPQLVESDSQEFAPPCPTQWRLKGSIFKKVPEGRENSSSDSGLEIEQATGRGPYDWVPEPILIALDPTTLLLRGGKIAKVHGSMWREAFKANNTIWWEELETSNKHRGNIKTYERGGPQPQVEDGPNDEVEESLRVRMDLAFRKDLNKLPRNLFRPEGTSVKLKQKPRRKVLPKPNRIRRPDSDANVGEGRLCSK